MIGLNNSIGITLQTVQKLALSQTLALSLSVLTLNARGLFQKVEDEASFNPAILFLNRKSLHNSFETIENLSDHQFPSEDEIWDDIRDKIENSKLIPQKKKFLLNVLDCFLDENLFLNKNKFVQKYKSQKYFDWLAYFKRCEPAGIGASNLQERFKYQLEFHGLKKSLAYQIIDECWQLFLNQNFPKIQKLLKTSNSATESAVSEIKKFCKQNILPVENSASALYLTRPDLILKSDGTLTLNENDLPQIKLDPKILLFSKSTRDSKERLQIKNYIQRAKDLKIAIEKRNHTLLAIGTILLEFSRQLNPAVTPRNDMCEQHRKKKLRLKDIALKTHLSQSTISRTLKNKFILTPQGIKPLEELKILRNHLT